jgi:hypothetical protein
VGATPTAAAAGATGYRWRYGTPQDAPYRPGAQRLTSAWNANCTAASMVIDGRQEQNVQSRKHRPSKLTSVVASSEAERAVAAAAVASAGAGDAAGGCEGHAGSGGRVLCARHGVCFVSNEWQGVAAPTPPLIATAAVPSTLLAWSQDVLGISIAGCRANELPLEQRRAATRDSHGTDPHPLHQPCCAG